MVTHLEEGYVWHTSYLITFSSELWLIVNIHPHYLCICENKEFLNVVLYSKWHSWCWCKQGVADMDTCPGHPLKVCHFKEWMQGSLMVWWLLILVAPYSFSTMMPCSGFRTFSCSDGSAASLSPIGGPSSSNREILPNAVIEGVCSFCGLASLRQCSLLEGRRKRALWHVCSLLGVAEVPCTSPQCTQDCTLNINVTSYRRRSLI